MATTRAGVGHMEEQQGICRQLLEIGRVRGSVDALEEWLARLKADVDRLATLSTQQAAGHKESAHDGKE